MWTRRILESVGTIMIGDGVLAAMFPTRHTLLWAHGPRRWRTMMLRFAARPARVRTFGVVETGLGLLLAARMLDPKPLPSGRLR